MSILLTGGARSGKSHLAEKIARRRQQKTGAGVIYIATAAAGDEEMEERIRAHKERRPEEWRTVEEELYPGRKLQEKFQEGEKRPEPGSVLLLDCITLLISNHMVKAGGKEIGEAELVGEIENELNIMFELAEEYELEIIMVTNEVGMGVVPPSSMGRLFRDAAGRINRTLSQKCERTFLMVAGKPVDVDELKADIFSGAGGEELI